MKSVPDSAHKIPVVIGVTGHRDLCGEDIPTLKKAVRSELEKLKKTYPNSELVMLNSLAAGGDTICAEVALELEMEVICPLPMDVEEYQRDFNESDLARFKLLLGKTREYFVAAETEARPEIVTRDYFYRQAGIYTAIHCHILLALWDGAAPKPDGCGTAEAVSFHLRGNYLPRAGAAVRSEDNGGVIHIFAPRKGAAGAAGTVRFLGNEAAVAQILKQTDEFNRLAPGASPPGYSLLPEDAAEDPTLVRTEKLYHTADALSLAAASVYRRVLALLAGAGTILTLAFLLYDEAMMIWMILVCGVMLASSWGFQRYAACSGCHRHYVEYRALAEALRVQAFLRYSGSGLETASLLSWPQQDNLAWVMDGLYALSIGEAPRARREIRGCWVEDQLKYHRKAGDRTTRKKQRGDRAVNAAFLISVALYLLAVLFELTFGGLIFRPVVELSSIELMRTALKIILGTLSAGTLFAANYYGKLSLPRQMADHEKMARFFSRMSDRLLIHGETEQLLEVIAREELAENGDWCSYQQDNTPEFSL